MEQAVTMAKQHAEILQLRARVAELEERLAEEEQRAGLVELRFDQAWEDFCDTFRESFERALSSAAMVLVRSKQQVGK